MGLEKKIKEAMLPQGISKTIGLRELLVDYKEGGIALPPSFDYSWGIEQASNFIASVILGAPIAPMVLYEGRPKKFFVIDGGHRLITLFSFYTGKWFNEQGLGAIAQINKTPLSNSYKRETEMRRVLTQPDLYDEFKLRLTPNHVLNGSGFLDLPDSTKHYFSKSELPFCFFVSCPAKESEVIIEVFSAIKLGEGLVKTEIDQLMKIKNSLVGLGQAREK